MSSDPQHCFFIESSSRGGTLGIGMKIGHSHEMKVWAYPRHDNKASSKNRALRHGLENLISPREGATDHGMKNRVS
jgi:hypothetical protein